MPERFAPLSPRAKLPAGKLRRKEFKDVTYPAGLSVGVNDGDERILVASNSSDEAILLSAADGHIVQRFDLSTFQRIPGSMPYTTAMTKDGKRGFVPLWNGSAVAGLDLVRRRVERMIPLAKPADALEGGSHPTALLLNRDNSRLFVALTNRDEIAVLDTVTGKQVYSLSTKLPGQKYGGSDPECMTLSADEKTLFTANAISDSVAVFDISNPVAGSKSSAKGFIPTQWYPTVVAATANDLLIGTAKGLGSRPNPKVLKKGESGMPEYPYVAAITEGSLARIPLSEISTHLSSWTEQTVASNSTQGNVDKILFTGGENKIHHVIYIIKENRTYDQVFGDLEAGDGDPSLTMFGEDITPNQHKLARQFGILDNFYDSGDVSGDGHVWSTSASISDYVEKTWPIGYRSKERDYDFQGSVGDIVPMDLGIPDIDDPATGYLWGNLARHNLTYRNYGEFVETRWCEDLPQNSPESSGAPKEHPPDCARKE